MSLVLVVEDEEALVDSLTFCLQKEGLRVAHAWDGVQALEQVERLSPDLVLLDIMIPKLDGREVCRELRARQFHRPVLLLTARNSEMDKVVGLEVGADDYITKPFASSELIARIRAHLRRYSRLTETQSESATLRVSGVTLDRDRREARAGDDQLPLSPLEFDLLSYLMSNPNRTLSRSELLDKVWGYEYGGDPSIVNVAIQRLRDKVQSALTISTVRGVGYLLDTR